MNFSALGQKKIEDITHASVSIADDHNPQTLVVVAIPETLIESILKKTIDITMGAFQPHQIIPASNNVIHLMRYN